MEGLAAEVAREGDVWWQRKPDVGDFFCIVCYAGTVIYGVVLPPPEDETLDVDGRWTRTWSQMQPDGCMGFVNIDQMDMLITREQFDLAKGLGWPGAPGAIRVVLRMQAMAQA